MATSISELVHEWPYEKEESGSGGGTLSLNSDKKVL